MCSGIKNKLDYLGDKLKVTALNIGPIYPSPGANFGYDVLNFKTICHHFGTMDDFESLRVAMHKRGEEFNVGLSSWLVLVPECIGWTCTEMRVLLTCVSLSESCI